MTSPDSVKEAKEKAGTNTESSNPGGGTGTFHCFEVKVADPESAGEKTCESHEKNPTGVGTFYVCTRPERGCATIGFHGRPALCACYSKYIHCDHAGTDVRTVNSTCLVSHGVHYYTIASGKSDKFRDYTHDAIGLSRENNDKPVTGCESFETELGDSSAPYDVGVYGLVTGP